MDRRAVGQPVGPLPPYVYWRRRLVAFLLLVGAVLLAMRFVGGAAAEEPQQIAANVSDALAAPTATAEPTGTPTPTPTAAATSTPAAAAPAATEPAEAGPEDTAPAPAAASATSASGPPECDDGQLAVRVRPDAEEYPEDVRPALTIEVVNTTTTPCTQDVGAAQLEVVVMQGETRVWSSDDCSPGGTPKVELLEPGEPYESTVNWSRQTSAPECPSGRETVESGTYAVTGRAADVRSEAVQVELT